ncbi:MAG: hypothetical protein HN509_18425 [Halobacteriovoraceae bacterium]|jgi:hypothetical protein|nr:hypothetical protein [Halobacteriovoraceae bacterium]
MNRFFSPKTEKDQGQPRSLIKFFASLEGRVDFPLSRALDSLDKLEATATDQEEFFSFLLEDVIFTSLYATFYEELFLTLKDNQMVANQITENFYQSSHERDNIVGSQTQDHVEFVENLGLCSGCTSCQNHPDVADLIAYWQRGDIDFFILLYVGMHTIQYTFDKVLEEGIPRNSDILTELTREKVLKFRQYLFEYTEKSFSVV